MFATPSGIGHARKLHRPHPFIFMLILVGLGIALGAASGPSGARKSSRQDGAHLLLKNTITDEMLAPEKTAMRGTLR